MTEVTGGKYNERPSETFDQVADGEELKESDVVLQVYALGKHKLCLT